ncbi:Hypothetical predicted protein [Podarcis lilfordi]|uniref:Uncharacterized protein n=1 Tax=Podarcis lilfordi TaxID=74358 RepID=A0AA35L4T1_9SAUR|nr:Hypothetical predicted protein [Podarcis lilfordi]
MLGSRVGRVLRRLRRRPARGRHSSFPAPCALPLARSCTRLRLLPAFLLLLLLLPAGLAEGDGRAKAVAGGTAFAGWRTPHPTPGSISGL